MSAAVTDEGWDLHRARDVQRAGDAATAERFEREAEEHGRDIRARAGDLAIANCWPYPDSWKICFVTRVDPDGVPTHMRDGAGTRYSVTPVKSKATIMPEYTWIVPRERLRTPAREVAAEHGDARFFGTGGARAVGDLIAAHIDLGAETDPARHRDGGG